LIVALCVVGFASATMVDIVVQTFYPYDNTCTEANTSYTTALAYSTVCQGYSNPTGNPYSYNYVCNASLPGGGERLVYEGMTCDPDQLSQSPGLFSTCDVWTETWGPNGPLNQSDWWPLGVQTQCTQAPSANLFMRIVYENDTCNSNSVSTFYFYIIDDCYYDSGSDDSWMLTTAVDDASELQFNHYASSGNCSGVSDYSYIYQVDSCTIPGGTTRALSSGRVLSSTASGKPEEIQSYSQVIANSKPTKHPVKKGKPTMKPRTRMPTKMPVRKPTKKPEKHH